MTEAQMIILEKRSSAFWIILNRPEKRNAINNDVLCGIREGYERAHADADVRVIVLTGFGDKAFCAGGDLQPGGGFLFDFATPNTIFADLLRLGANATLPVIARVNGTCMAGGMGLLAMADVAVASDHALFGLPEVKLGLFPMQVLALLQHLVPPRKLREWCLTGEPFDAAAALDAGLLNYVVGAPELNGKTAWLIDRMAARSPTAIRRGKYAMRAIASMSVDEGIAYMESQLPLLAMTEDAREGLASFNEKRPPVWTGR